MFSLGICLCDKGNGKMYSLCGKPHAHCGELHASELKHGQRKVLPMMRDDCGVTARDCELPDIIGA